MENFIPMLKNAISLLGQLLVALSPILPFVLPALLPALLAKLHRFQHGDMGAASDAISRAGLLAATRFSEVLAEELKKAQAPDSPGGATVTDEERFFATTQAGKASVAALPPGTAERVTDLVLEEAVDRMKLHKEWGNAVKAYDGDVGLVRASLRKRIESKAGLASG